MSKYQKGVTHIYNGFWGLELENDILICYIYIDEKGKFINFNRITHHATDSFYVQ